MKLNDLMELCITLQSRVLDLEQTKTTHVIEIDSLKIRVKKLEKKQRSRTHKLKRLYKVSLTAKVKSSYEEQSLGEDASKHKRTSAIDADEVNAAQVQVSTTATTTTISINEVTLAQAFAELKHTKPKAKAKGIVFYALEESTTTTTIPKLKSQDKGWNHNSLKNKSFANNQELFDKAMKRVNTFVDYRTKLVKEISKKAKEEVIEGSSKRADGEREAIDVIPLAVKPPSIAD
nr:hypothetical protein [Tanacetum cinerariifolium]